MINRRKEPRFRVRDNAFAVDSREPQRLGRLIDISRSGISFQYLAGSNHFGADTELHIFSSVHPLFLEGFPFETISDLPIPGHPASTLPMRRHGGCFPALAAGQRAQLDKFIRLHSVGVDGTNR